uniref:50S ribosomal protein L35 n=1 Tax=Nitzschia sp. PL1-4 TaxID=2083272 RepID=A0A2Z5ZAM5_9STRA|nr:ribosomal protein L35 [Nitzschia sp. PL1-4]
MLKKKTCKAVLKRFKIIKNKFYRCFSCKNHLLSKKSRKKKRKLSQIIPIRKKDSKKIKLMLFL